MIGNKKVACIIPARLRSSRFPCKMLASLKGKPLLQWVWERAKTVPLFDTVLFAVDSQEVASLIDTFEGKWQMTSEAHVSGSDRIAELVHRGVVDADIIVNWQGDEPFICKEMIDDLLQSCHLEENDIWTLKKRIVSQEDLHSVQIAKVTCNQQGQALYFSRSPIPCYRDGAPFSLQQVYKHVGLYAYTKEAIKKISTLPACSLEQAEQLEQLRFLYHGMKISVHETQYEVFGIDLPEHLLKAEAYIEQNLGELLQS